jgi:hypothetical protein
VIFLQSAPVDNSLPLLRKQYPHWIRPQFKMSWLNSIELVLPLKDQVIRIRLSGYQDQVIRIRLSGPGYLDQVIRIRLSGSGYQDRVIRIRLSRYRHSDTDIAFFLSIIVLCRKLCTVHFWPIVSRPDK